MSFSFCFFLWGLLRLPLLPGSAASSDLYSRKKLFPASRNSRKPERPKGKGQKAAEPKPKITEVIANRIMDGKDIPFNFEARLQKFFCFVVLIPSMEHGLIPTDNLTLSGDGTVVHTHSNPRGHRCRSISCNTSSDADEPRHYSDPDASRGWDSDLDKYYYGYTLFQFSCHNKELHTDLPLLLRFTSARRHDSVSSLIAFHELETHMPELLYQKYVL